MRFVPAKRENVHLIVGMVGGSGSGKTYSALRLASGMAQGKRFAVIDTEARRALHYASEFTFDHLDLEPPFTPTRYHEAVMAAEESQYPVIVIDSMSHEHTGEGGLLDWHDNQVQELIDRAKKRGSKEPEWALADKYNMQAWIEPKRAHKRLMDRITQIRANVILCFRAESKIKIVKENKKSVIVNDGWHPICEKNVAFELIVSFLLSHERPGAIMPVNLKLPKPLIPVFREGTLIDEASGENLLKWASGDNTLSGDPVAEYRAKMKAAKSVQDLRRLYTMITADKRVEVAGIARDLLRECEAASQKLTEGELE